MRDRLITALVGLAIAVIVLYGGPRAYMVAEQARTTVVQQTERSADLIAAVLTERSRGGGPVDEDLDALVHDGEVLVHRGADGRIVASAGEAEGHAADVVATRRLPDGSALELTRSGAAVSERITDAVMPIVLIGLGVVVLAVLAAVVLARGLARPFQRLADAARRLGDGTFSLPPMDSTLPEARAIGVALQTSSRQLEALLHRERQFAANASHQLRTPLTALRLELEDLTYWPETAPAVSEQLHRALGELDRLSGTVTELLEHSRGRRLERPVPVDLALLTAETAARWDRQAGAAGRTVTAMAPRPARVRTHPGLLQQILDVLIHNALRHGRGVVRVRARDARTHWAITVQDEGDRPAGPGIFDRHVSTGEGGEGIGLTVAAELAESLGGSLTLESVPTTTFLLRLPAAPST
ncbi:sensor histidine kinase [Kocuria rosea]|jgi:signal transduction histidine kinase|uniref:sensor histidine kinase n=1 Tax=Kocuria TaxID=57493 RepID=UPI000E06B78B|nr:HAMP domain-containing sensor histidine kinase [Kocuria rosea]STX07424.1 Signal transduction histidine-protein kinase ArlS [Kocuria rosea]